ncbi:Aldedh-domain-containing protein [Microthyrium microscopicum]|uniref:aldehyde dehydrogenase (NAD(+)) n=1 Tax=Microthyrium microscopicum TaxID=703497 RepID=A0A6A6U4Q0_9PEZI|nr:Aldedh-domain-containing protein [Microthyrium microscopicum]
METPQSVVEAIELLQRRAQWVQIPPVIWATTAALGSLLIFYLWRDNETALLYTVDEPEQCKSGWQGTTIEQPSIQLRDSSAIQCYCPATGQLLGLVNPATKEGIDRAIIKASEAQKQWAATSFSDRRKVLKTLLKFVLSHQDSIAQAACLDSGKTRIDASFGEILVTAEKLKWTIDHGERYLRPERRPTNFLMFYKKNQVIYEPLGVVCACVSWNYPFHNLLGPIISAIFAGNGIIVKGSEQTAWCSQYFISIVKGALKACGHDPNLVQSIMCWPNVANHLTSHPQISHITFIGSRKVAHQVAESAAKPLTPVCLELGGKDAAIVLDDLKDIDRVVATLVRGTFQAAGQNCIGIERIICLPGIYDTVVSKLLPIIERLRIGSALHSSEVDVGACISAANFDNLETLITAAAKQGAKLLVGGKRAHVPDYPAGHYFQPTLLVNVDSSMKIARTELFAPVCVVMRAKNLDDAIKIANSTEFGLGASVFGRNTRDLDKVVREVKAGMVSVNDFAVYYAVQLPFGGTKGSGYGRFAGSEGLRSLCNTKSICSDRWSFMKTSIPTPLQLPVPNEPKGWNMSKGIVELGYGESPRQKARGITRLMGF